MIKRDNKGRFTAGTGPGPGRLKGKRRRTEAEQARDLIGDFLVAYKQLGGVKSLVEWARSSKTNMKEFYKILMNLFPSKLVEQIEKSFEPEMPPILHFVPVEGSEEHVAQMKREIERLQGIIDLQRRRLDSLGIAESQEEMELRAARGEIAATIANAEEKART